MEQTFLGIDIGSVTVAVVLLDNNGSLIRSDYRKHKGESEKILLQILQDYPLESVWSYGLTGVGAERLGLSAKILDSAVAQTEAVRHIAPGVRNILYIGGGSFSLIYLDEKGDFLKNRINSACASGTGAFLDQQALRLGITPETLGRIAADYKELAPMVATRCAVFAKTDMIHLQQEGFPIEAVAKGLCNGLGASTVDGLLGGAKLEGKTALLGGVALNECVAAAVGEKLGVDIVIPERPELADAIGAAFSAREHGLKIPFEKELIARSAGRAAPGNFRPPLELKLSKYPDPVYFDKWVDSADTEIALLVSPAPLERFQVALGIDIGSTSTKAVLTDRRKRTIAWCYRKTSGEPLKAVQHIFRSFRALEKKHNITFEIIGAGTTGSGRKMTGRVIGADLVLNEITAHARAAVLIDPDVETILELGGQDAKFTQLSGGVVYNSVMNYVCAAGTGSFIEEQANKLGIPIEDFADMAMGVEAPVTSDRCTVYMERDLDLLLGAGMSKPQVAAAVLHSVCDNYLNKVVGGLGIGGRVLFQGATARNRALVAAFENRLGVPVNVSPLCHVTGALGMALFVLERLKGPTTFRGFEFADEEIKIENEICELCRNHCRLSLIRLKDETVAWGLKCGREYEENKPRLKNIEGYSYLKARNRVFLNGERAGDLTTCNFRKSSFRGRRMNHFLKIGIPRSLSTYTYLPFWKTFFNALGCEVVLSPPTTARTLALGEENVTAEFCAPLLAGLGHVRELFSHDVDFIFLPHMIRDTCPEGFTNSCFCCYVQSFPSIVSSLPGISPLMKSKLLIPVVDLYDERSLATNLHDVLKHSLGVGRRTVLRALREAGKALKHFHAESLSRGKEALDKISRERTFGIVLVGRPYNTLDIGMNLDLPGKIADMGYTVIYQDMLDVDPSRVSGIFPNMYWKYGQQILSTADYVACQVALFPIYFTSFSCGPDSYILSYFKQLLERKSKPYLVLQFDGHGADAGYLTRVEAAIESFCAWFDKRSIKDETKESPLLTRERR